MNLEKAFRELLTKLTDKGILTAEEMLEIYAVMYPKRTVQVPAYARKKKGEKRKSRQVKEHTRKKKEKKSAGKKALKLLEKMLE